MATGRNETCPCGSGKKFVDPASGLAFEVDYEATDESVVADDAAEIADDESVPGWRRREA